MLKKIIILLILTFSFNVQAAESNKGPMPKHEWSLMVLQELLIEQHYKEALKSTEKFVLGATL